MPSLLQPRRLRAAVMATGLALLQARPDLAARTADDPWSTNRQLTLNPNGAPHAMPAVAAAGGKGFAVWFDCSTFLRQAPGCLPFIGFGSWTGRGPLALHASASDNFINRKAYPSIAADGRGRIYALWLDGREYSGQFQNADKADVFFSWAQDGGTWAENVRLNAPPGSAQWEDGTDLQVDEAGNAAAVWVGGGPGIADILYSYRPTGGAWSPAVPVDETAPASPRLQPALALDAAGHSHVVWAEAGAIRYAYRPFGGRFSPSERIDDGRALAAEPDVAVAPDGRVHAAWSGAFAPPAAAALFHREKPAGEPWRAVAWLDMDGAAYVPRRTGPSIATNDEGDVYLAWQQIEPVGGIFLPAGDARFAFRPAAGAWRASEKVNDGAFDVLDQVSLAVDDEGGAHLAWTDDRLVHTDPDLYRQDIFSASRERPEVEPPEKIAIRGRVYGAPDASQAYPVIGAPVALMRGTRVLRRTLSQAPDGAYVLDDVPKQDGLAISTTLRYDAASPPTFRVTYGRVSPPLPVHLRTFPMQLAQAEGDLTRNLVYTSPSAYDMDGRVQAEDLASLAVTYFHTRQAALLAEALGQRLDLKLPVDVVSFSRTEGVFWRGPNTLDPESVSRDPFINLEAANAASYYLDSDTPTNREWHEFGHHVMGDAFSDRMPWAPGTSNHDGYKNPSSTDSWVEGFAEFYSLLVHREIARAPKPSLYTVSGSVINLEDNYLAWTNEEFAVAGLLWDLQDPASDKDASSLRLVPFHDGVAMDHRSLWELLTRDWGQSLRPPAHAPAGYGHIMDVKHLYDALVAADVGAEVPPGKSLSQLEALFVAHGLFADGNGNKGYDEGEAIGQVTGKDRPGRRKAPEASGSFIAARAKDAETGAAVAIRDFTVSRCYAPPLADRGHAWRQRPDTAHGKLYLYGTDPQYAATFFIVAHAGGYRPSDPLALRNADYWRLMEAEPPDHFLEHTFVLERGSTVYLPSVRRAYAAGLAESREDSARRDGPAQLDPPLLHCGPEPPETSPTPGPSPTRRPSASPTTAPSVTPSSPSPTPPPSPTLTAVPPSPSPDPTAGGPAQRAVGATTTDPANLARTAFVAGDGLWLWALLQNDEAQPVERDVEFSVLAEGGLAADALSWRGKLTLPPGATWFRIERVVPADLPPALYQLSVTVTVGGAWTSASSWLHVARTLTRAEDFSDPSGGWPLGSSADSEHGYVGGEYRIAIKAADKTLWTSGGARGEDLVVEADLRIESGVGGAALVVGLDDAGADFTVFGVDRAGRYGLYRSTGGSWRALVPWSMSPAVPAPGRSGHLMLTRRGDRVRLFIDGQELAGPAPELIPAGRIGLYAEATQPVVEARFDNLRVYGP